MVILKLACLAITLCHSLIIRGWLKDEQKVRDSVDTVDSADFFLSMLFN